jgi:hypothetical protein
MCASSHEYVVIRAMHFNHSAPQVRSGKEGLSEESVPDTFCFFLSTVTRNGLPVGTSVAHGTGSKRVPDSFSPRADLHI